MDSKDEAKLAAARERHKAAREQSKRRHPSVIVPAQKALRLAGRCGSHDGNGHLCTKRETEGRHPGKHEQQVIGGVNDGLTEWEWEW